MRAGCATAIVLNKWDLRDGGPEDIDLEHERARVAEKLRLRPRVLTASAKSGRNVSRLLSEAIALGDRVAGRIPTAELNRFLAEAVQARQPPVGTRRGSAQHRLKLIYMTQTAQRPPRFAIQVNSRARVTRDYAYFLENRLRALRIHPARGRVHGGYVFERREVQRRSRLRVGDQQLSFGPCQVSFQRQSLSQRAAVAVGRNGYIYVFGGDPGTGNTNTTFIYVGIDAEGSGLFAGTRGRQIAGRFGVISCQAFPYGTTAQRHRTMWPTARP